MKTRKLRARVGVGALPWLLACWLAGCQTAQQAAPAELTAAPAHADLEVEDEERQVARSSLGRDAEMLLHGNLALNGREQVLAVNRFSAGATPVAGGSPSSPAFVTRAAILEKNDGKWSQILLCDEHLKNPDGYLGGSPAEHVSGWRLEYSQDEREGLLMKFTPGERPGAAAGTVGASLDVRWNKNAKRYQTFDQSHERYLSEVPSLETPQSILK